MQLFDYLKQSFALFCILSSYYKYWCNNTCRKVSQRLHQNRITK